MATRLALVLFMTLLALDPLLGQEGAPSFQACSTCHGTPDPRLTDGALWISRIAVTACVQPMGEGSAGKRNDLMNLLRSDRVHRPRLESAFRTALVGEGEVQLPYPHMSVLLVAATPGSEQPAIRLVASGEKDLRRVVPEGRYRVQSYTLSRTDVAGVRWALWGSGSQGATLSVSADKPLRLRLLDKVKLSVGVRQRGGRTQVSLGVTGDSGMGLTVVCGKERVPAFFLLHRADGEIQGALTYG